MNGLTLLTPTVPGWVLQRGPFRRGLRPRGNRLHRPGLFSRQPLQTDVPLLKHLLDVLQALQGLQDAGLQAERRPYTTVLSRPFKGSLQTPLLFERAVCLLPDYKYMREMLLLCIILFMFYFRWWIKKTSLCLTWLYIMIFMMFTLAC